ncbi:hypothetical protein ACS0TY_017185 [Phlomoides rotata]
MVSLRVPELFYGEETCVVSVDGFLKLVTSKYCSFEYSPADGSFTEETVESDNETSKLILDAGDQHFDFEPEKHADNLYDLPAPYDTDIRAVKHEYIFIASFIKSCFILKNTQNYKIWTLGKILLLFRNQY